MQKTTIILSNLNREDFLSNNKSYSEYETTSQPKRSSLSFVDRVKLNILNVSAPQPDYYLKNITHWSNLPFLSRVIIILSDEEVAANLYTYLQDYLKESTYVKITLQENLLQRSKSLDGMKEAGDEHDVNSLAVLTKFKNYYSNTSSDSEDGANSPITDHSSEYSEPKPRAFDAYNDLAKLGIDLTEYNDQDQINELKSPKIPQSPQPGLSRTKSLTKTLFKPDLKIKTNVESSRSVVPQSPTITLDESV